MFRLIYKGSYRHFNIRNQHRRHLKNLSYEFYPLVNQTLILRTTECTMYAWFDIQVGAKQKP